jgi:hypothetical protein
MMCLPFEDQVAICIPIQVFQREIEEKRLYGITVKDGKGSFQDYN